jgi:hypothetical protein
MTYEDLPGSLLKTGPVGTAFLHETGHVHEMKGRVKKQNALAGHIRASTNPSASL